MYVSPRQFFLLCAGSVLWGSPSTRASSLDISSDFPVPPEDDPSISNAGEEIPFHFRDVVELVPMPDDLLTPKEHEESEEHKFSEALEVV